MTSVGERFATWRYVMNHANMPPGVEMDPISKWRVVPPAAGCSSPPPPPLAAAQPDPAGEGDRLRNPALPGVGGGSVGRSLRARRSLHQCLLRRPAHQA